MYYFCPSLIDELIKGEVTWVIAKRMLVANS